MKTKINIGTDMGSIYNVTMMKEFNDISFSDVENIAKETHGDKVMVFGWVENTKEETIKHIQV